MERETVVTVEMGGFVVRAFRTMAAAESYIRNVYPSAIAGACSAESQMWTVYLATGATRKVRLMAIEFSDK